MRAFPLLPLLLGAAVAALPASRGGAAPCTPAFDALAAEVDLRAHLVRYPTTPEQREEKAGLQRARRVLVRFSRSYRRDAASAGVAGRTLLALYPGVEAIEDLVRAGFDGLREDLGRERDDLALTAGELSPGTLRDRALEGVAEADLALAEDDGADPLDADARSAALGAAARSMERAFRRALPGVDGRRRRTCGDEMWAEEGGSLLWKADRVTAIYQKSADRFFLRGIRARYPADRSELDLEVENVGGVGTYPLAFGSGKWVDAPFTRYGIVEGGSLTITALDEEKGTVEGTFTFTARGCVFDCTAYAVTGGRFRLKNLLLP